MSEGGGGVRDATEDERGDDGIVGAGLAGVGTGMERGAGGKGDPAGEPAVGLVAGPEEAGRIVAEIDAVAGADLENLAGKAGEQGLFAGGDEGFVNAAGEPHEEGEPHLLEFDGEGTVGFVALVGELGCGFAFVVPDDLAGLAAADGEFASDGVFALVGAIVEENDDLIGGADARLAGDAGEVGGFENPYFFVIKGGFDREGGGEQRSRHKSG